ncbi:MAG TPA: hypothetical protein PLL78_09190 [Fimbriimonadaceae bacterium]|nr:hypothetical protein [Fimbriimonadaceae bacterium]HRJ96848.1 hypothetical protein [Fimbriimonadaceae bacterium]
MRTIALLATAAMTASAVPCSVFYVYDGRLALAGDSEDWIDPNTQVWFVPKTATTHGVVYFGFGKGEYPEGGIRRTRKGKELPEGGVINIEPSDAYGFPQAGMNDAGLFFGGAATDAVKTTNGKPKFDGFFADYVLRHCATVKEALEVIARYDVGLPQGQILLGDRLGNSAVIEAGNAILPGNGKYQVITNFRKSATKDVTCPRYKKLDTVLSAYDKLTVPFARDAIASVGRAPTRDSLEKKVPGTQYSVVFDLTNGIAHLYNRFDFRRDVRIDVKNETSGPARAMKMSSLFP